MKPGPLEGHSTLQELWSAARCRPCNFTFDEIRFHREWFEAARQIVLAAAKIPQSLPRPLWMIWMPGLNAGSVIVLR